MSDLLPEMLGQISCQSIGRVKHAKLNLATIVCSLWQTTWLLPFELYTEEKANSVSVVLVQVSTDILFSMGTR